MLMTGGVTMAVGGGGVERRAASLFSLSLSSNPVFFPSLFLLILLPKPCYQQHTTYFSKIQVTNF